MRALKLIGSGMVLLLAGVAQAQVTGTVTVVSDYDFRGISQTQKDPALQGSIDWAGSTGWYAGLWGSNVDFDSESDIEIDGYFGYAMENDDGLGWDVGFTYYSYWPDDDEINYPEVYAGVTYKMLGFKVWYTNDYVNSSESALYLDGSLNFELPNDFGLSLHVGRSSGDGIGDSYVDYSVGVTRSFGGFDFELKYVDTDIDDDDNADGRLVLGVSMTFPPVRTARAPTALKPMAEIDWRQRAGELKFRTQAFIDGRYVDAASGETFDCISPIDGRVLAKVASTDAADVDAAVTSARKVFEKGTWSRLAPAQRKRTLLKFAELIRENREELALTETLDMGKPIGDSLRVDVAAVVNCLRWFAEAVDKVYDEVAPTGPQALALITREATGVVGAIVPWNFPLLMAMWKLAPALATGNSVILKPSEKSPLTALRLAEIAVEAGIPPGVLNVLPGFGQKVGKALALHMDVDCLAFTGSTATGRLMLQYAGQSNMKRVWLECGGKSPNIVMADAADLDRVARASAEAIFFNQGEMCSAGSRLIVEESIREPLLEKITAIGRAMIPGDPLDPATKLGAIVDAPQLKTVMGFIESGRSEGARVALGGRQMREDSGGFYVEPTVFDGVTPKMKIAREEIFGPVLSTLTFKTMEEAVQIANDVVYGLAAAIWTRDINTAHRAAKALRAGTVYVNCYDADDITVPFGGFKQSGNGRDKSLHAFDKYTELKTTWIDLS